MTEIIRQVNIHFYRNKTASIKISTMHTIYSSLVQNISRESPETYTRIFLFFLPFYNTYNEKFGITQFDIFHILFVYFEFPLVPCF